MFAHFRHLLRLTRIAALLARNGALPPAQWQTLRGARGLARTLEQLGPSFIKLGQTLSTRADLIGVEAAAALADLRDRLPPFSSSVARRILQEELGKPIETVFKQFDDIPIAAASIAQVHRAQLPDGQWVAVKILRPNVARAFKRDIALFYWIARQIVRRLPASRRLKPVEAVTIFGESVRFELDLRFEAAAMQEMTDNTLADTGFRIPRVHWPLTSGRVLIAEWVDGIPIHEIAQLQAARHDVNRLLANFSRVFFMQAFRDGFFHADLHPGNLFVDAAGDIVAVDFGIMGRLDWKTRIYIAEIFRGFLSEDWHHVAQVHFRAGYVPAHKSVEQFAQAAMAIAKPILDKPVQEISMASLLGQLFAVTEAFEMETQPQLLLFQKTLVVVEGVGRMLNPNVNMWEMARAPIEGWATEHFTLKGKARHAAKEAGELLEDLPQILRQLRDIIQRIHEKGGSVTVNV